MATGFPSAQRPRSLSTHQRDEMQKEYKESEEYKDPTNEEERETLLKAGEITKRPDS